MNPMQKIDLMNPTIPGTRKGAAPETPGKQPASGIRRAAVPADFEPQPAPGTQAAGSPASTPVPGGRGEHPAAFPAGTRQAISLEKLIRPEKRLLSERMSSRMVKCASVLEPGSFLGWQMQVPRKGRVRIWLFGTGDLCRSDLEWAAEKTGKAAKGTVPLRCREDLSELYELWLPVTGRAGSGGSMGFGGSLTDGAETAKDKARWPAHLSGQFQELVRVLQLTGGLLRVTLGPAGEREKKLCRNTALRSFDLSGIPAGEYIGTPVRLRVLLRLPAQPSIRLRTVFEAAVPQSELRRIGPMADPRAEALWENPLEEAPALPDYAARILVQEPELQAPMVGLELCEEEVKKIPAAHKNTPDKKAVIIGKAVDMTGAHRKISIGELDLRRHYQIIGQTGTGKSTLLATLILDAIQKGHGLTFFDPHGTTIDTVLRCLPEACAHRVRVVRIGDADNPVPLNIWDSDDPLQEERNISDLCELFGDIFNTKHDLCVGPRYERWLSTFARASIAFFAKEGRRASLESIAVLSQSQDNMLKLAKALIQDYPELVETIKQEYGKDRSSDFQNILNWYLCKFQRFTSVEQLRRTLGAGVNALDFAHTVDTDTVTLIDLATPTIGTHAARIVGTLTLMKLWNALTGRKDRDRTHLVVVDEASMFQTNPMPRMLAESRKFGVSMVLCHQFAGQLTQEIQEALESNSANFTAFRLSPRDAATAAIRFDDPEMRVTLTRLNAFNAITTLSVEGRQTPPFTLETMVPKPQKNGEELARQIEARSIETLVKPYAHMRALTAREIQQLLNTAEERWEENRRRGLTVPKSQPQPPASPRSSQQTQPQPPASPRSSQQTQSQPAAKPPAPPARKQEVLPDWLETWNKRQLLNHVG